MKNYKNKYYVFLILTTVLVFLFLSCSNKAVVRKYYLIEQPAPEDSIQPSKMYNSKFVCEIIDPDVHPAFQGPDIAFRNRSNQITYFAYHHWAVEPSEIMADLLKTELEEARLFKRLHNRFWGENPDYALQTKVQSLEIVEQNKRFFAHLNVHFKLRENSAAEITLEHRADRLTPLKNRNINLFAAEISRLFAEEIHHLMMKISAHLAERSSGTAESGTL